MGASILVNSLARSCVASTINVIWRLSWKHHSMTFLDYEAIHPVRTPVNPTFPPSGATPHLQVHLVLFYVPFIEKPLLRYFTKRRP